MEASLLCHHGEHGGVARKLLHGSEPATDVLETRKVSLLDTTRHDTTPTTDDHELEAKPHPPTNSNQLSRPST
jgi:hypothetical protein